MIRLETDRALVHHDDTWTERTVPTRGEVLDKHGLHGVSDRRDVQELAVRSA